MITVKDCLFWGHGKKCEVFLRNLWTYNDIYEARVNVYNMMYDDGVWLWCCSILHDESDEACVRFDGGICFFS